MNAIVKSCKYHGELTINQVFKRRDSKNPYRCKKCNAIYRKRYVEKSGKDYKTNSISTAKSNFKIRNKITIEQYKLMLEKQNNVCAICFKKEIRMDSRNNKISRLCVDHCHETGKIRGLLCHKCNLALGCYDDSIENLKSAIKYLELNS